MTVSLIDFEKDIQVVLAGEQEGSYSTERVMFNYKDPFIQALWVGYQLGFTRRLLQEANKDQKKIPALCKASDFKYNTNQ